MGPAPPARRRWGKAISIAAGLIAVPLVGLIAYQAWLVLKPGEVTIPSGRAVPQAFCDDLKQVVASAAETKFTSILGPQHSDIWTARIQLPGWEDCTVRDWTYEGAVRRYYSCVLRAFSSIEDMDAMLKALQAYVKPCLGSNWSERRSTFSDGTSDAVYEKMQSDPFVRLRETYYDNPKEWVLRIDVENPPEPVKN
jgi:hypothetical protein